jgi:hypothetical protein
MKTRLPLLAVMLVLIAAIPAGAQTPASQQPASGGASNGKVGVAVSASTLGVSFDAAMRLSDKANLRAGVNTLGHSRDIEDDEITFEGTLKMRSVHAYLDWFPFGGGFHISPGMIIHNGNRVDLTALIPAGDTVEIDGEEFLSSASNPIRASGDVTFKSTRPAIVIGWGNMIPRSRRISVPFQLGVVFQGAPMAALHFTGTGCALNGTNCRNMATDANIQTRVQAEQAELNDDIKIFRFYPVLSLGIGIKF